ncbi:MAG: hypothetical protein JW841_04055 [Deltaproteobacteria bacterium]|nr:hypothetical protein [Deltaproteobacteria bacterium]
MRSCIILIILLITFTAANTTAEENPSAANKTINHANIEQNAITLIERGNLKESITFLKTHLVIDKTNLTLKWLLARAYLLDGNDFWSLRTLKDINAQNPGDCESFLWIAFIQINQGALDDAQQTIAITQCHKLSASQTRKEILLAMIDKYNNNNSIALEHLNTAKTLPYIYTEDHQALMQLLTDIDQNYVPAFTGKLELATGWSNNANAQSLTDTTQTDIAKASIIEQMKTWWRFVWPTNYFIRPSFEIEATMQAYNEKQFQDLSYLEIGARPGILLFDKATTLLAYHFNALLLRGGDNYSKGPLWFYNTHRAELDISLPSNVSFFAGIGRRAFREIAKSRTEVDGGIGVSHRINQKLHLLGALAGRWHSANHKAYNIQGASALISNDIKLAPDWHLRTGILASIDNYPHSVEYFTTKTTKIRRDALLKLSASGYSPTFLNSKIGLTYEYAVRNSTLSIYDYNDHRILLKFVYNLSFDPWLPKSVTPEKHIPLPHQETSPDFDERIQDLLRQDEAMQRSSSCIE